MPLPLSMPLSTRPARFTGAIIALTLSLVAGSAAQAASPSRDVVPAGALEDRAVAATLPQVERYILTVTNCIRTGGTVRADGTCSGRGSGANGGYRAPLILSRIASDRVARPYSKLLVSLGECNHWFDGSPDYRLRRGGISFSNYGENIGCRDNDNPFHSVRDSYLNFQSEKSYNGWHWRNIKNPSLTHVGIGIWKVGNRIRFTTDFYRP